jgi:hypothetical protein
VIGVQVGVDRLHQLQVELADELEVAIDLFKDRIDDQRFAATAGREQVGVGAGRRVEQLTEDHDCLLRSRSGSRCPLCRPATASYFYRSAGAAP